MKVTASVCVFVLNAFVLSSVPAFSGEATSEPAPATVQGLPEAIASFGAVVSDGWIYVYSGHIGTAHDHSKDNLSQAFRRRKIAGGDWEELPMETPLQGLALVAHDGLVYRIGGLSARNAADADADLHSLDTVSCFDPATKTWSQVTPLPEGRSSHDATVVDGKIYVVGGWKLSGASDDGEWHDDILIFDTQHPEAGWKSVPQPFTRRALTVTQHQGVVYAVGGMDDNESIDRTVNRFDPNTQSWSEGPTLPGQGMNGFGASAWSNGHALLASGSNGVVYQLSADGSEWNEVGKLTEPRFFHQLVPGSNGEFIVLGGASRKGHLDSIEIVQLAD